MVKQKVKQTKEKKTDDPVGFFVPAGIFIGMGVGFFVGNLVGGLFLGLGLGFLAMACLKVDWNAICGSNKKRKR